MALSFQYILKFYRGMSEDRDVKIGKELFPIEMVKGLRAYRIGDLLLIEQNPKKETRTALMAKAGHQILWVIDTKMNKYLFRVIDGKITRL